jgi:lysophospholipase L1-like esterase
LSTPGSERLIRLHLARLLSRPRITREVSVRESSPLSCKTSRSIVAFILLCLAPYALPGFSRYRMLPSLTKLLASTRADSPDQIEQDPVSEAARPARSQTPGEIEDPSGHALDHLFDSLSKTELGDGQTRITHYGDSPITNDGITSTVRRKLQARFGDAGHGFVLIAKPWGWYSHSGIEQEASRGWHSDPLFISRNEHFYGLGGVSFTTETSSASFSTTEQGDNGHTISSFELYYLARPGGGDVDVEVDGRFYASLATAAPKISSGFYRVQLDEGPHSMTVRGAGTGTAQLFGVVLESSRPGVEYDSLGLNGAFIGLLANYMDPVHWTEQLRHRKPDLVIIGYGTNESQFENLPMDRYEVDTREAVGRIREALPEASIMLVGPMDRGIRAPGGGVVTRPMIPRLISYQRRLAAELGCAFFDTYSAMGGGGTVARWLEARPKLMGGDFTHPTAQGAEIVGTLLCDALMRAYDGYKNEKPNL